MKYYLLKDFEVVKEYSNTRVEGINNNEKMSIMFDAIKKNKTVIIIM
jgi:hypothetical protein